MYQEAQLDSLSDGKHNSGIWTLMIHLYCDYYGHYLTHSPVANRPRRRQFFVMSLRISAEAACSGAQSRGSAGDIRRVASRLPQALPEALCDTETTRLETTVSALRQRVEPARKDPRDELNQRDTRRTGLPQALPEALCGLQPVTV